MTPLEAFAAGFRAGIEMSRDSQKTYERERKQRLRQMSRDKDSYLLNTLTKKDTQCPGTTEAFERFWLAYPRKRDRKKALERFRAAIARGVNPEVIICGAAAYAAEAARDKIKIEYLKHGATWLNGDCWENYSPNVLRPEFPRARISPEVDTPDIPRTPEQRMRIAELHRRFREGK